MQTTPRLLLALLAGAPLPFAFSPYDFYAVAPVSLAALFYLWSGVRPGQAFSIGLAYGLASFLGGIYWTYISVRIFGEAPIVLSLAATFGLVFVLALFPAVAGFAAAKWFGTLGARAWLGVLPGLWVLTEWCRGWIFTGFGWLSVGYSQTDSWLMGYAPVLGLHGMSFAVALTAGSLLCIVRGGRRARATGLMLTVAIWVGGFALGSQQWTAATGRSLSVALVQGSITQDLKWRPEQLPETLSLYRELTLGGGSETLIVWPEVAIPSLYEAITAYLDEMRNLVARRNGTLVLGVMKRDETGGAAQNAVVALTDPPQFYVKRHLVPFGEYFPIPTFAREWLRLLSLPYTDVAAGEADQAPLAVAGERVAVTICYEDVFGIEQIAALPAATLLVNVSNDAWFGDSIAPHQHLQIARLRAAEVGRYLLRSTNTGITAIIDARGDVVMRARQFEPAVLRGVVSSFSGATPYVRWKNYPVLIVSFLLLLAQLPMTKLTIRSGT